MSAKTIRHDSLQDFDRLVGPEGWVTTTIGDIVGLNPPKPQLDALPPDAPVTFVPMPAVDAYHGKITAEEERRFGAVRKGYTSFRENDVIFAKITPCMENGKSAVVRTLTNGLGFGSTEFHVLRSSGAVVPDYLFYYLRQESFRRAAEAEMTGSVGQKRVPANFIKNAPIPLAPLAEQKRIVAKVEELIERVNEVRERLAKVKEILKRFRQSVLATAFTGGLLADTSEGLPKLAGSGRFVSELWEKRRMWSLRVSQGRGSGEAEKAKIKYSEVQQDDLDLLQNIPKHWQWISLSTCTDVTDGTHDSPKYHETGIPLITSKNLTRTGINFEKAKLISVEDHTQISKRSSVSDGDILFAMIGTIGHPTIIKGGHPFSIKNVGLLRTFGNIALAKYLKYWLSSMFVENYFRETLKGSSQPFAPLNLLRRFPVPIPPRSELNRLVVRVEELLGVADLVEARIALATKHSEGLPQAILAKAFSGELVPTEAELARQEGRYYEPASILIAKTKAQGKDIESLWKKKQIKNHTN